MADYAITAVDRRVVYSGSAGTGPYSFNFPILTQTDLSVYIDSTKKTLTTDYTVTLSTTTGTGSITFTSEPTTPTSSNTITIVGGRVIQRASDYATGGDLLASSLNTDLDSQTIFAQQISEDTDRAIKAPVYDPTTINMTLPAKATRANRTLGFDGDGNPTTIADFVSKGGDTHLFIYATSTTDSDPGGGYMRFNHASPASATIAYISDTETAGSTDVSAWVQSFDDALSAGSNRGRIRVTKANATDTWHTFIVNGALVDASGYTKLNLSYVDGAGTLSANDKVFISFTSSGTGTVPGLTWKFDSATTDRDPGSGEFRINHGTYSSSNKLFISDTNSDSVNVSAHVLTFDDSTSTIKGYLHLVDVSDSSTWVRYSVGASSVDATNYNKLNVTYIASNNTFSAGDTVSVHFTRTGNTGDTGST